VKINYRRLYSLSNQIREMAAIIVLAFFILHSCGVRVMEEGSLFVRNASIQGGGLFEREENDPFFVPMHKHDFNSEMFLVTGGGGAFNIDGCTYVVKRGTLLFYQRGVWHEELSTTHPFAGMYVGFSGLQIKGLPPDYVIHPDSAPFVKLGDAFESIRQRFLACIMELYREMPGSHELANHMLGILMVELARIIHYPSVEAPLRKPSRAAVSRARNYMEENFRDPITLETLSKVTYVNEYHLAHLFKEELGISPIQFLIRCRVEATKRYLTTTRLSLKEIGELVGYQSETSFHHIFKKTTGVTPGQYRSDPC
jgi:AraC-like DNA-binding protein